MMCGFKKQWCRLGSSFLLLLVSSSVAVAQSNRMLATDGEDLLVINTDSAFYALETTLAKRTGAGDALCLKNSPQTAILSMNGKNAFESEIKTIDLTTNSPSKLVTSTLQQSGHGRDAVEAPLLTQAGPHFALALTDRGASFYLTSYIISGGSLVKLYDTLICAHCEIDHKVLVTDNNSRAHVQITKLPFPAPSHKRELRTFEVPTIKQVAKTDISNVKYPGSLIGSYQDTSIVFLSQLETNNTSGRLYSAVAVLGNTGINVPLPGFSPGFSSSQYRQYIHGMYRFGALDFIVQSDSSTIRLHVPSELMNLPIAEFQQTLDIIEIDIHPTTGDIWVMGVDNNVQHRIHIYDPVTQKRVADILLSQTSHLGFKGVDSDIDNGAFTADGKFYVSLTETFPLGSPNGSYIEATVTTALGSQSNVVWRKVTKLDRVSSLCY